MVGTSAVLVVVAITGYLFVTNLREPNQHRPVRHGRIGRTTRQTVNTLQKVNALSNDVNTMTKLSTNDNRPNNKDDGGDASTVMPAVEGPRRNGSPWMIRRCGEKQAVDSSGSSADIDKYVIHQQDIEAVINALWEGGAEYMKVMD